MLCYIMYAIMYAMLSKLCLLTMMLDIINFLWQLILKVITCRTGDKRCLGIITFRANYV